MKKRRIATTVLMLAGLLPLTACSTRQAYDTGQNWQRQQCQTINDAQERARCLAKADTSYDDYRRQSEAARQRQ